jgi:osmotically-inducible protein OsmY
MEVVDKIQHYDLFTVYDDFQGTVKSGVVFLRGAVTDEKKLDDVIERVAKIRGVQAIDNKVTVLPANQDDNRLRSAIATAIYSLTDFERYSMANPPIHVIVNRGHVTLVGVVRSDIEKRKAYEAARFINGVLALEDKVVVAKR